MIDEQTVSEANRVRDAIVAFLMESESTEIAHATETDLRFATFEVPHSIMALGADDDRIGRFLLKFVAMHAYLARKGAWLESEVAVELVH